MKVAICAVIKGRSIEEVEALLAKRPDIKIIAESKWPDCEEKFQHFSGLEKHFVGRLQKNKIRKIVPLVDVIQSVDSWDLLEKINVVSGEFGKKIGFLWQINVSEDISKAGLQVSELKKIIKRYFEAGLENVELLGLMTIGAQVDFEERRAYFRKLKTLFDEISVPLPYLSMGMSADFEIAIEEGATMVRLGRVLFE